MVELAIAAPLFLTLFTACFQFGYYFYIYNRLENAVRDGARYASIRAYDSSSSTPSTAFSTAVTNMVLYGSPASGSTTVVPGLKSSNINLSVTMTNGVPSLVKVSISGYSIYAVFGNWTLTKKPAAIFPYEGRLSSSS